MQDLHKLLPDVIRGKAIRHENEYLLPYPDVLDVVDIATRHGIAILGVEVFEVQRGILIVKEYSRYEFPFFGDWEQFVCQNNTEARHFIEQNIRGEEHGYILTSTSRCEFEALE